ncbi:MAG: hypothetical protein SGBAC_012697, partial [Bacillariaceae sp.]
LPSKVYGLLDCARYQIEQLESQVSSHRTNEKNHTKQAKGATVVTSDPGVSSTSARDSTNKVSTGPFQQDDDELEDALDDGFMCIDLQTVQTKLQKWNQLFPQVKPFFAMKCNPDPMVVKLLASCTTTESEKHNSNLFVGFDVASWAEIQLALEACGNDTGIMVEGADDESFGNEPQLQRQTMLPRLVYANPQRAEQDLKNCMNAYLSSFKPIPLWLTLDGPEELVKILQISQQLEFPISRIGLILRILVPDHHSSIPLGEKFGTPLEEIASLVQRGLEEGFQPTNFLGISFHCGSGCHDPATYQLALELTRSALDLIHSTLQKSTTACDHRCSLIDIGGGFPGWDGMGGDHNRFSSYASSKNGNSTDDGTTMDELATEETTRAIAEAIQPSLQAFAKEGYQIIAEPGRFFVEAAAGLVSRIYDKQILTLPATTSQNQTSIRVYKIAHGVQGVFKDVLLFGDWLCFDRMGAYTLSIASRAGRPVICYVKGGGSGEGTT